MVEYDEPEWWTIRMISEKLNVAMSTVRSYVREGRIQSIRIGNVKAIRIHVSQVNMLIQTQSNPAYDNNAFSEYRAKKIADNLRQQEQKQQEKELLKKKLQEEKEKVYLF